MAAAKPVSRSIASVPAKASRSAALKSSAAPAKRSAALPAGEDETPDFGDAAPAPKATAKKVAPAKAATTPAPKAPAATAPKAAPKAAAKAKGGSVEVLYRLEKETPGAGQYQPVGPKGEKLAIADSPIGAVYVRKDKVGGELPKTMTATFSW